jgi:hypothetical protein
MFIASGPLSTALRRSAMETAGKDGAKSECEIRMRVSYASRHMALLRSAAFAGARVINMSLLRSEHLASLQT